MHIFVSLLLQFLFLLKLVALPVSNVDLPSLSGTLYTARFVSRSGDTTFYLIVGGDTMPLLVSSLHSSNCATLITTAPFSGYPMHQEVIQHFRNSGVVLTTDQHDNSTVMSAEIVLGSRLPAGADVDLRECLNNTIGTGFPLVPADDSVNIEEVPQGYGMLMVVAACYAAAWCFVLGIHFVIAE
ncbi:hypothetical protein BDQ17DRAFT_1371169 [Cyathus striatus]|nr:hypothetical protein BDQ17DRAFT_1371169 [Cyathus striatus]